MQTINEHILKLTGKVTLPKPLSLGKTYEVVVKGDVTEVRDIDNQDGTFNREFKFEPLTVEVVNDKGDSMKAREKGTTSKKQRGRHHFWAEENNNEMTYDQAGALIIKHYDEVMDLVKLLG